MAKVLISVWLQGQDILAKILVRPYNTYLGLSLDFRLALRCQPWDQDFSLVWYQGKGIVLGLSLEAKLFEPKMLADFSRITLALT